MLFRSCPRTFGRRLLLLHHWLCSVRKRKLERPCGTPCHIAHKSESWALPSLCRATPSTTSEHFLGLIDSRQSLRPRRFLRFLSTEAPSLHRHYPASSVLRASPSPHTAQPDSHELPVDPNCDHRWGFPCCYWSTLHACRRHYPGRSDETRSLVLSSAAALPITRRAGSCVNRFEAFSAFTARYGLHARQVT